MSKRSTGVPASTFATAVAVQKKASVEGLDWGNASGVVTKIREELDEVELAIRSRPVSSLGEEIGDLLFSVVNLARMLAVDPEEAFDKAINKFERRFHDVRALALKSGKRMRDMSPEQVDVLWRTVKRAHLSDGDRGSL